MCIKIFSIPKEERTGAITNEIQAEFLNPDQVDIFTENEAEFNAKLLKKYSEENDHLDAEDMLQLYNKAKSTV